MPGIEVLGGFSLKDGARAAMDASVTTKKLLDRKSVV